MTFVTMLFFFWALNPDPLRDQMVFFLGRASKNTPNEGDPRIGPGPSSKCDFLVLKSTLLGGLSFSGFLIKTEPLGPKP